MYKQRHFMLKSVVFRRNGGFFTGKTRVRRFLCPRVVVSKTPAINTETAVIDKDKRLIAFRPISAEGNNCSE